jgi:hypothetical protein
VPLPVLEALTMLYLVSASLYIRDIIMILLVCRFDWCCCCSHAGSDGPGRPGGHRQLGWRVGHRSLSATAVRSALWHVCGAPAPALHRHRRRVRDGSHDSGAHLARLRPGHIVHACDLCAAAV